MPVDRDAVLSPPPREYSASPPPFAGTDRTDRTDQPGPSKKSKVTANDLQRRQLDKLLNNPDKEIRLPTAPKERTLRAPVEMMKSVQGSSSGAGSGEFHVYKQSRRREYERLKLMEDKAKALEEQNAFKARQEARDAITDAKTAKNRLKRLKRKSGRKGPGPADAGAGSGAGAGAGAQVVVVVD
ncbi:hypothetical protein EHS25_007775 [Saitozyma podzolica]|uniref:DUF1168-domain-containing protein n=1 Tax=Saitozyma podzolica TaxID=1890683 RepID=A0A427YQR6_9TREE|nr:hypothetical protein EHS25_007775 [Saitozyma podzolica]